jgi:hypothetical protein
MNHNFPPIYVRPGGGDPAEAMMNYRSIPVACRVYNDSAANAGIDQPDDRRSAADTKCQPPTRHYRPGERLERSIRKRMARLAVTDGM